MKRDTNRTLLTLVAVVAVAGLGVDSRPASAFTQSGAGIDFLGNAVPMGHEWITRLALLELIGGDPVVKPDPNDPRKKWTKGKAKNTRVNAQEVARIKKSPARDERYQAGFRANLDAIVGERWVDLAGFNVTNGMMGKYDCFDGVSQEPVDIQYDHFMRRYDDRDGKGGVRAAQGSQMRFVDAFVAAAMAPTTLMKVWDGGGYASLTEVDRNYFLFGRALHLFEDSFSPEHTVRLPVDNFERVREVKSYLCAAGSEQHSHSKGDVLNYSSGDVVWKPGTLTDAGWAGYKPSNMKDVALVAVEATKDAWAAFIRTMGTPPMHRAAVARSEAEALVMNWLSINPQELEAWYQDPAHRDASYVLATGQAGKGVSVAACMQGLGEKSGDQMAKVRELEKLQRICLYNVDVEPGYGDLFDPNLHMPFNWKWKTGAVGDWKMPPDSWQIPSRPADTGVRVRIKSVQAGQYLSAPDGVDHNQWIYARKNGSPVLDFILVGSAANGTYRLANASLFLSYNNTTGAVKLWDSADGAWYAVEQQGTVRAIRHISSNTYMYMRGDSPYITRYGDPKDVTGHWVIDGLP
jgi:hypothetical protein